MEYNGIHIVEGDGLVSGDSAGYLEYLTGSTILTSQGVDATTRGAFDLVITESDGGNSITALSIDTSSNVVLGEAALATTATDGFFYMPTCAGVPTGVPTTHTGRNPIVYDTTNDDFYVYEGGAWATVGGDVAIPDLSDVTITTSAANELLFTTGANTWVNYTLAEAGIQPLDTDLTNIAALTGTSGFLKTDGSNTWSVDTATYLTDITAEPIQDLSNVTITTSAANELLFTTGANTWVNYTLAEAGIQPAGSYLTDITAEPIQDLSNVTITSLGTNELLFTQDGSTWINQTLAEAGISATGHTHALDDASDVTIASLSADELLFSQNGTTWVNQTLTEAGISAIGHSHTKSDVTDFTEADYVHVTGTESVGGDKTFSNNIVITGDLTVNGTTTYINTTELDIGDNIIVLNFDETGVPSQDGGIEIERGTSTNARFLFEEATDLWKVDPGTAVLTEISLLGHTHTGVYEPADGTILKDADIGVTVAAFAHTHPLAAGATDVTATFGELNLLDLAALTAGWVLSADSATTASWKAPNAGGEWTASGTDLLQVTAALTDIYFADALTDATPLAQTLHAQGGSGTDIAGASLTIAGGIGTGTGVGGDLLFQTAVAGTTSATPNTLTTRMTIDEKGNMGIGSTPITNSFVGEVSMLLGGLSSLYFPAAPSAGKTVYLTHNMYKHTSGVERYIITDEASYYRQGNGTHLFEVALSGTADTAITWQTALLLTRTEARFGQGCVKIGETAAAVTDTAGYGQVWVKDDVANTLWFTDDAGTDFQIGGTGLSSGAWTTSGTDMYQSTAALTDTYFADALVDATPLAHTIHSQGGSGTDIAGANLTIAGGIGTGTGVGGDIIFQTAAAGASSSTPNALVTALTIDNSGHLFITEHGTAGAPSLALGSAITGLYSSAGNNLFVSISGTSRWQFQAAGFKGNTSGGPELRSEASSSTNPTLCPNENSTSTGMGASVAGDISLITGSVERMRIGTAGGFHIAEVAAAETNIPDYGQIWVKNDVANTLWFTDDAGSDFQIGGTGLSAGEWTVSGTDLLQVTAGITDVYMTDAITDATPLAQVLHGQGGVGTDIAGAALTIAGGIGTGTGVGGDIIFQTATPGTTSATPNALVEAMRIDDNGFVGIGTGDTISPWYTPWNAIQLGNGTSLSGDDNYATMAHNVYADGNNSWRYEVTNIGEMYQQSGGDHNFYSVPSGTAGNIATPSLKFRIDDSGNFAFASTVSSNPQTTDTHLFIGGTATIWGTEAAAASGQLSIGQNTYEHNTNGDVYTVTDQASIYVQTGGTHQFKVAVSGTLDTAISWTNGLTINNDATTTVSERLGIGNTPAVGSMIHVSQTIEGATTSRGVYVSATAQSDATLAAAGFETLIGTQATSYTLTDLVHFKADEGTLGAGSTITRQYGFRAEAMTNASTSNYAFYGNNTVASTAFNLYMAGSATNYLAGELRLASGLVMFDAASVPITPLAGRGQIWVKNDTPDTLMFTDDAGTDFPIGGVAAASAVSTLSDVTITSSAANELLFTTGADTWVNYTLAEAGIQPLDTDLTNIAALTGTSGFLKTDGATVWSVDTATYLTDITGESIASLSDVTVTTSAANELLFTTGANTWVNYTLAEAGIQPAGSYLTDITAEPIQDLSNVTITSLGTNELLFTQDGSTWINQTLAEADLLAASVHTHDNSNPTFNDVVVDRIEVNEVATFDAEHNNGNSGASITIDWSNGNKQLMTMTADCTISFTDPPGVANLLIRIVQDVGGTNTTNWPTANWVGGTEIDATQTGSATDIFMFYFDGTNYWGSALQDMS